MCAKSKGFFGLRRGSTKSLTFQVLDGQQITKDRVSEVRNPQTRLQMVQRVILLTACQAYSLMKELVDHSLEGIQYGAKTQQAFMTANIRMLREKVAAAGTNYGEVRDFTPLGSTHFALNNYLISKGTLSPIEYSLSNGVVFAGGATYADVIAAVKGQVGDQLTFLCVIDTDNAGAALRYCRVILQPQDAAGGNLPLTTPFIVGGKVNAPNLRNEMTEDFTFSLNAGNNKVTVKCKSDWDMAYAIIASRKYDGDWLRSTQTLLCSNMFDTFTMSDAIDSLNTQILATSNRYLNNAGSYGNEVPSVVTSVLANGAEIEKGASYSGAVALTINGENLSTENVQVMLGDTTYVPLSQTATQLTYSCETTGTVTVRVNGKVYASFFVDLEPFTRFTSANVVYNGTQAGEVNETINNFPANINSLNNDGSTYAESYGRINRNHIFFKGEDMTADDVAKVTFEGSTGCKCYLVDGETLVASISGSGQNPISIKYDGKLVAVIVLRNI